jgi:hypothetical protein
MFLVVPGFAPFGGCALDSSNVGFRDEGFNRADDVRAAEGQRT